VVSSHRGMDESGNLFRGHAMDAKGVDTAAASVRTLNDAVQISRGHRVKSPSRVQR